MTPFIRIIAKESFGAEVATTVTTVMGESIKKVTSVQNQTRKSSTQVEVDDDFATLAAKINEIIGKL